MVEISAMSLHFVVLSFDRYSRDDVIGEVILPLNEIDLNQIETQQVAMCKEIQPRSLKVTATWQITKELPKKKTKKASFDAICRKLQSVVNWLSNEKTLQIFHLRKCNLIHL